MTVYDTLKEWKIENYKVITKEDLNEITIGSTILATGGGGDPDIGLLWAYRMLEEGKDIVLVEPEDVPDDILITIVGCLGAPIVLTEKPPGGQEIFNSLKSISAYIGQEVKAIIPAEAGGVNMTIPMAVAGALGLPVINADGMGRAFPELQMTSFFVEGINPAPIAAANEKDYVCLVDSYDGLITEQIIRNAAMAYGGISWIAGYPMLGSEMKRTAIHKSVSQAWELGKSVVESRKQNLDPLKRILEITNGYAVFKGKVIDINRDFGSEKTKGFSSGVLTIEGIDKDLGSFAEITFQNEWLKLTIDGEVISLPPDLIVIIDPETGEAVRTDIVKYGYRGNIVVIPADKKMRTEKGIETFGPRAFGFEEDFTPVEELINNIKVK